MNISAIVAAADNGCIGKGNKIPWYLPADLKYFKKITMGHHMIMGRKCFESIGKALPGRTTIILSRQENYWQPNCVTVQTLEQALSLARFNGDHEAMIVGGGEIYRLALPLCTKVYKTQVSIEIESCEISFPTLNSTDWNLSSSTEGMLDERNKIPHVFEVWERKEVAT